MSVFIIMLFSLILPPTVHVCEATLERTDITLFPVEAQAIKNAVPKRTREFTTVRACARDALRALGAKVAPLVPGKSGAPRWPHNVVGSMTHCRGLRAAAVANKSEFDGIGIDCEPDECLPPYVLEAIASPQEIAMLQRLAIYDPSVSWDRALFCAKEAAYKAWAPLHGSRISYHGITVELACGTFKAVITGRTEARFSTIEGQWICADGLICVAVALKKHTFNKHSLKRRGLRLTLDKEKPFAPP
jgi:4'-phosphopantetheinyl transferase EntD